jgi:hypothetical protein
MGSTLPDRALGILKQELTRWAAWSIARRSSTRCRRARRWPSAARTLRRRSRTLIHGHPLITVHRREK